MKTPLALVAGAIAIGILTGYLTHIPVWVGGGIVLLCVAAVSLTQMWRGKEAASLLGGNNAILSSIAVMFFGVGMISEALHRPSELDFENEVYPPFAVATVLDSQETAYGNKARVSIDALTDRSGEKFMRISNVNAFLTCKDKTFSPGDEIMFVHALRPIEANGNFRDSGKWAQRNLDRNILYRQTLKSSEVIFCGHRTSVGSVSMNLRDRIAVWIERSSLQTDTKRFLVAILVGDASVISPDEREAFSHVGLAHILALSGMHVGIIAGILLFLLAPLSLAGSFRLRYVLTLLLLWFYAAITGFSISVVRAALMATFVCIGIICQRRNAPLNALCGAVAVILLWNPLALFDAALLLSAVSVAAILVFCSRNPDGRKKPAIIELAAVSIAATGATWALVSHYFGQLPLLFLPVNLIVTPLLPFYMGIALLYTILLGMGVDAALLAFLLDTGWTALDNMVEIVNRPAFILPFSVSLFGSFVWGAALLVLAGTLKLKKLRIPGIAFCLVAILVVVWTREEPQDMVIIRNFSGDLSLGIYEGSIESEVKLPQYRVSEVDLFQKKYLYVDTYKIDEIPEMRQNVDYLVVGKNYRGNVSELLEHYNPSAIVISGDVYSTHRESLMQECSALGVASFPAPLKIPLGK